jgi:hypothetical protein
MLVRGTSTEVKKSFPARHQGMYRLGHEAVVCVLEGLSVPNPHPEIQSVTGVWTLKTPSSSVVLVEVHRVE